MAQVFRFDDRKQAEAEHHLVELRDGKHYRMRTGNKDQPGDRVVRIHELSDRVKNTLQTDDVDTLVSRLESGELDSAATRLCYDSMVDLIRLIFFEPIPDDVLNMHTIEDMRAITDQYFLIWSPPNPRGAVTPLAASPI